MRDNGGAVNRAVHTLIIHNSLLQNALLCVAIIPIQRKSCIAGFARQNNEKSRGVNWVGQAMTHYGSKIPWGEGKMSALSYV